MLAFIIKFLQSTDCIVVILILLDCLVIIYAFLYINPVLGGIDAIIVVYNNRKKHILLNIINSFKELKNKIIQWDEIIHPILMPKLVNKYTKRLMPIFLTLIELSCVINMLSI